MVVASDVTNWISSGIHMIELQRTGSELLDLFVVGLKQEKSDEESKVEWSKTKKSSNKRFGREFNEEESISTKVDPKSVLQMTDCSKTNYTFRKTDV